MQRFSPGLRLHRSGIRLHELPDLLGGIDLATHAPDQPRARILSARRPGVATALDLVEAHFHAVTACTTVVNDDGSPVVGIFVEA